jgi:hypothetical protein
MQTKFGTVLLFDSRSGIQVAEQQSLLKVLRYENFTCLLIDLL